jgi:hypothetical protein
VVEHRDPQQFPGPDQAGGHLEIFRARGGIAARVVVHQDQRRGGLPQRGPEYLAGVDQARRQGSLGHDDLAQHAVTAIQQQEHEALVRDVPQAWMEVSVHVSRVPHGVTGTQTPRSQAATQFLRGHQSRALRRPHPGVSTQLSGSARGETLQPPVVTQQSLGQRRHIPAGPSRAQKQGEQLPIAKGFRAVAF